VSTLSVLIRNARLAEELSLDRQGFQLVGQETAVHDFYDRTEVEMVYYPDSRHSRRIEPMTRST
jgi:hypothetical protein